MGRRDVLVRRQQVFRDTPLRIRAKAMVPGVAAHGLQAHWRRPLPWSKLRCSHQTMRNDGVTPPHQVCASGRGVRAEARATARVVALPPWFDVPGLAQPQRLNQGIVSRRGCASRKSLQPTMKPSPPQKGGGNGAVSSLGASGTWSPSTRSRRSPRRSSTRASTSPTSSMAVASEVAQNIRRCLRGQKSRRDGSSWTPRLHGRSQSTSPRPPRRATFIAGARSAASSSEWV